MVQQVEHVMVKGAALELVDKFCYLQVTWLVLVVVMKRAWLLEQNEVGKNYGVSYVP